MSTFTPPPYTLEYYGAKRVLIRAPKSNVTVAQAFGPTVAEAEANAERIFKALTQLEQEEPTP